MTTRLADMRCEACRDDSPKATPEEITRHLADLPDWQQIEVDHIPRVTRSFGFRNFLDALAFANKVGAMAEAEDHHPQIIIEWGKATVSWWTHAIGGLHLNDFILAARCDDLFAAG